MKTGVFCIALAALYIGAILTGCATTGGAATPEEDIRIQMERWRTAMIDHDLDAIMAVFSDKFEHFDWRDKAGARQFIQEAIDIGYLDDIEVHLDQAEIKVDGTLASVYPVNLAGAFGSLTMELFLTRENGKWLVTGLDAPGM